MKPLIVLVGTFGISLLLIRLITGHIDPALSATIGMSVMLIFTGIAHFTFTKGMTMMVPAFIPFKKKQVVYLSGIFEIVAAICLLIESVRIITGWTLIVFFILMLPANIKAANQRINYQKGTLDGSGISYLWFRIPLQIVFITWVYFSILY